MLINTLPISRIMLLIREMRRGIGIKDIMDSKISKDLSLTIPQQALPTTLKTDCIST